jgi:hypothetical protein
MSRQGGAGGALCPFPGSLFACIGKRPRNSVFAHPAHPRGARGSEADLDFAIRGGLR